MIKNKKFVVHGWTNGKDYDNNKCANYVKIILAKDLSDAEDKGDRYFTKCFGTCEVVCGYGTVE